MKIEKEEQKIADLIKTNLDNEITHRIKNFTLLWNIYETFACNKNANYSTILNNVDKIESATIVDYTIVEEAKTYFFNRYFNEDKTPNDRFPELVKSDLNIKNFILRELPKEVIDKNTLLAMLLIIYRYRNNLFHGNKNVVTLNGQIDNFAHANELLIIVLEMMKDRGLLI